MIDENRTTSSTHDARLAELIAARICHDLGSPVASITAILPQATDAAAHEILVETTDELRARLRLFSAAFGSSDEMAWADLPALLLGAPMAHRVRFDITAGEGMLAPARVRLILSAALLAAEALPRGGVVRIAEQKGGVVSLLPEGRDAGWSPVFLELMAGGSMDDALAEGPRRALAPWLCAQALTGGASLSLPMPVGVGVPPLLLLPVG